MSLMPVIFNLKAIIILNCIKILDFSNIGLL